MSTKLECFSSIEELAPVFEHGGTVTFIPLMIHRGSCSVRGEDQPWEIHLRTLSGKLHDQKETLVHEFVHLSHHSHHGYLVGPRQNQFLHEVATERATADLINHNPQIADQITKELILHPHCSILFSSDEARDTPFWNYYCNIVAELANGARDGTLFQEEARQLKVLRLAHALSV